MYIRGAYAMSGSTTAPFDVNQITHFLLGLQNPLLEALKPDDHATYAELLLCGVTLAQVRCAKGDPSSLVNFAHALHTWVEHYANEKSYLALEAKLIERLDTPPKLFTGLVATVTVARYASNLGGTSYAVRKLRYRA